MVHCVLSVMTTHAQLLIMIPCRLRCTTETVTVCPLEACVVGNKTSSVFYRCATQRVKDVSSGWRLSHVIQWQSWRHYTHCRRNVALRYTVYPDKGTLNPRYTHVECAQWTATDVQVTFRISLKGAVENRPSPDTEQLADLSSRQWGSRKWHYVLLIIFIISSSITNFTDTRQSLKEQKYK